MTKLRLYQQLCFKLLNSSSLILAILISSSFSLAHEQAASTSEHQNVANPMEVELSKSLPSNHRMDASEDESTSPVRSANISSRKGRQYDGSLSSSGTGNYASVSGDGAAYVAQVPVSGTNNYGASSGSIGANYSPNDLSAAYHGTYHDPLTMARGYPSPMNPLHHPAAGYASPIGGPSSSMFGLSPPMGSGGLLSSSMFPLMSKGFDVSEVVCSAIAVAVGAVIVGAPFILLYLFIMNQMGGGNGGPGLGPSGGAISLTGPTSSTTVSGRKKRHTSLPEALFKQLSPLVNNEQVANTFKVLMNSIAKYQV